MLLRVPCNNLSVTEDLVTVMMCNEVFDSKRPDKWVTKVLEGLPKFLRVNREVKTYPND